MVSKKEISKTSFQTSQIQIFDCFTAYNYINDYVYLIFVDYLEYNFEKNQINPIVLWKSIFNVAEIMKKLHINNHIHKNLKLTIEHLPIGIE